MKKIIYNLCFFLFLCINACKTPTFVEKDSVTFETGFPIQKYSYGVYCSPENQKEYIYFCSNTSDMRICFFTPEGKQDNCMPDIIFKKNALKGYLNINSTAFYNKDTVVIIDKYSPDNKMAYGNKEGEVVYQEIFESTFDSLPEKIWFLNVINNHFPSKYIYFRTKWNCQYPRDKKYAQKDYYNSKFDFWEYLKQYMIQEYAMPQICKYDAANHSYILSEPNMIQKYLLPQDSAFQITDENSQILNAAFTGESYDNKVFAWMDACNKVLVLNPDNLQVETSFEVLSDYGTIGGDPFLLKDKNQKQGEIFEKSGAIDKVLYDKNKNRYYVITRHKLPFEDFAFLSDAAFSIHIYDKNFKKLGEQYFEEGKYDFRFIILTSKGLYIAKNENSKDYDPEKVQFFRFEVK
ncbi:MAG: hypothetical protein J5701_00385 [Bacteroidales bacterium]|nr:hypothetical protein [Bacteroidales bacterium]